MKTARFTESQIISISMAGGLLQVIAFGTGAFSLDRRRMPATAAAR